MAADERTFAEVMQDILHNVQDILRSEVRLAKTEIREEAIKVKAAVAILLVGAMGGVYAVLFLLLTTMFLMARSLPLWAAALIIGATLAVLAAITLSTGLKRLRQLKASPPRTIATIKENVEWAKQQTNSQRTLKRLARTSALISSNWRRR